MTKEQMIENMAAEMQKEWDWMKETDNKELGLGFRLEKQFVEAVTGMTVRVKNGKVVIE